MITITVLQRDRSEAIEGVIATHVANDDDWRPVLANVMSDLEEISKSNGMRLWWEFDEEDDWRLAPPDDLQPCIHGYETDHDGKAEDGGDYVVTLDVRRASQL